MERRFEIVGDIGLGEKKDLGKGREGGWGMKLKVGVSSMLHVRRMRLLTPLLYQPYLVLCII